MVRQSVAQCVFIILKGRLSKPLEQNLINTFITITNTFITILYVNKGVKCYEALLKKRQRRRPLETRGFFAQLPIREGVQERF